MTCKTCNTCDPTKILADTFLKFAGTIPPTLTNPMSFLMDGLTTKPTVVFYPVVVPFNAKKLKTNVSGTILGPGSTLRIRLLRDGLPVPGFELNYGGVNPGSGVRATSVQPEPFAANQFFDLEVTTTGLVATDVFVSAVLEIVRTK